MRIRVGGLQGTSLCKQHKQILAGAPQAAAPEADGVCWSQGRGPEQRQRLPAAEESFPGC